MKTILQKTSWVLFGLSAIMIGLYPIIYFLIDRTFGLLGSKSPELLSNIFWNVGFYGHIVFGGISLLIGWLQFSKKLRQRNIKLHRNIGKLYMLSVFISGTCGLYIALFATGGMIAKVGFFSLGVVWLYTTIMGLLTIKKGEINKHQQMMVFSYAACFGAVTLRIWLPILTGLTGGFIPAYRIVAWLAWVPNLMVAYMITSRSKFKLETT